MDITYVSFVGGKILISNVNPELIQLLKDLGGQEDGDFKFVIKYSNENEKIKLFTILRDLGIAFSAGRDWSPSEQFEDLRDKGLIKGKYKYIEWRSPENYHIDER